MIHFCATAAEFQTALNNCVAGDVIRLDHTKTFEGNFVAKNRGVIPNGFEVIIESDIGVAQMPGPGRRINPTYSGKMPKVRGIQISNYQNIPALKFAPGANGYYVRWLEFLPQFWGAFEQIAIGTSDSSQTEYSQIPYNITLDQCYLHGDEKRGQLASIGLHGDNVKIINNYFSEIKATGQDAMCIRGSNCRGPWLVENNFLEGSTYSFITGGDDVKIRTIATVLAEPAPTTTGCRLSTTKDLSVGQLVAILWSDNGVLRRKHPRILTVNHSTGDITYANIGVIPAVPGDVKWGVQLKDVTFRRNYCTKKLAWKDPIMAAPTVTFTIGSASPGLGASTYYYRMTALHKGYLNNDVWGAYTAEKQIVLSTTSSVKLSWGSVALAERYRIYRYQKNSSGTIINLVWFETVNLDFTDIGGAGTAAVDFHSPTSGRRYVVKNAWELKVGVNVLCENNIFENSWKGADIGMSTWIKNNNQGGRHQFSELHDCTLRYNVWRHVSGWVSFSGIRASGEQPDDFTERPYNIRFENNLVFDSGEPWTEGANIYAALLSNGAIGTVYDHNTVIHGKTGTFQLEASVNKGTLDNTSWKNNLFIRHSNGFKGQNSTFSSDEGKPAIDAHCPGYTYQKNVIAGANGHSKYTPFLAAPYNCFLPDLATFQAQFKKWGGSSVDDWKLKRISEGDSIDSLYLNIGTDGKDLGCDIVELKTRIAGVDDGVPETPTEPPVEPPSTSNVRSKVISFASAVAPGTQYVEIGFAPKAILFFYSQATADGEASDFTFGMGAACLDGTRWAGHLHSDDAVATSKNGTTMRTSSCIAMVNENLTLQREANVSVWGQTGFTLNWTTVHASAHLIHAVVLGGDGVQNSKAIQFQTRTTNGNQDVATGFDPTLLFLYAPTNGNAALPLTSNRNSIGIFGVAVSATEQGVMSYRIRNANNPSRAWRSITDAACYQSIDDTQIIREASFASFQPTGFRLNWTTTDGNADNVFALAIKGPRGKILKISEALGQVIHNVGFKPEAILFFGNGLSVPTGHTTNSRMAVGAASSPTERFSLFAGETNNTSPVVAKIRVIRDGVIQRHVEAGATAYDADLTAISSTGFTLTGSGSAGTTEDNLALAIGSAPTGQAANLAATLLINLDVLASLDTAILLAATLSVNLEIFASLVVLRAVHHSVVGFLDLRVNLDVKREVDSGEVNCLASDVGGTQVLFNKAFKDVDSITLTVSGIVPRTAIYDFVDSPNPTQFKILVFDNTGSRVNAKVSWKARGIV